MIILADYSYLEDSKGCRKVHILFFLTFMAFSVFRQIFDFFKILYGTYDRLTYLCL